MRYRTPAALEMAVKAAAKASPLDTNLAISGFYFHRLLCRVFSEKDRKFVLKGGLSVLARTVDARATRDIDLLAQETELGAAVEELRRLASVDLGDFMAFRFDKAEPIKSDDEYRSGAKVWFTPTLGGKPLQPLSIDLVVDEVDGLAPEVLKPADRLDIDGLPVFDYPIYRAECALADKPLAMLETHNGRPSSRVKDLVDAVVYAKACEIDSTILVERVAKEAATRKAELPKAFAISASWFENYEASYKKMAKQAKADDVAPNLENAQELARKLYEPAFEGHRNHAKWNPGSMRWVEE